MSEQFPLFDELDQQAKEAETKALEAHWAFMAEPARCLFCNETMQRSMMAFNHGIVFNGWCMKALALHTRNQGKSYTEESSWLLKKGIDPGKSRFDESHWHLENKEAHYDSHYQRCYLDGCDK